MIYAATGHRPNKTGGYGMAAQAKLLTLARRFMRAEVLSSNTEMISGMAQGWDTAWAIAALDLGIPLTCAVPFEGQERLWPAEAQRTYRDILRQAHRVEIIHAGADRPHTYLFQKRNEWMVNGCNKLVALWDGSPGGTANCVNYADKIGRKADVVNLWTDWITMGKS